MLPDSISRIFNTLYRSYCYYNRYIFLFFYSLCFAEIFLQTEQKLLKKINGQKTRLMIMSKSGERLLP